MDTDVTIGGVYPYALRNEEISQENCNFFALICVYAGRVVLL